MEEEVVFRMFEESIQEEIGEERPPYLDFDGRREQRITPPNWMEAMRSINERMTKAREEEHQIKSSILQYLDAIHQRNHMEDENSKSNKSQTSQV